MSRRPAGELTGLVVLVTGATGSAGRAAVRALSRSGADVVAVGREEHRLAGLFDGVDGVSPQVADLSVNSECAALVERVRRRHGRIDGLVHLVGGWRGGSRFTANSDQDWEFLCSTLVDSLRHISIAVHDDLLASADGRMIIVSATAVDAPTPGSANYAAAKAATEAWIRAMAESFARAQSKAKSNPEPQRSAATIIVIRALVDDALRDAHPDRTFAGFTDVHDLARTVVELFTEEASDINGVRISLA